MSYKRMTVMHANGPALEMGGPYEDEAAARADLAARFKEAAKRLYYLENTIDSGRMIILPTIPQCHDCPLNGALGGCHVTGSPEKPQECRAYLTAMAKAQIGEARV